MYIKYTNFLLTYPILFDDLLRLQIIPKNRTPFALENIPILIPQTQHKRIYMNHTQKKKSDLLPRLLIFIGRPSNHSMQINPNCDRTIGVNICICVPVCVMRLDTSTILCIYNNTTSVIAMIFLRSWSMGASSYIISSCLDKKKIWINLYMLMRERASISFSWRWSVS